VETNNANMLFLLKRNLYTIIIAIEIVILATLLSYVFVDWESRKFIVSTIDELPVAQAVVIPGSAVLANGTLSSVLRDRVDTAIAIYRAGKAQNILVTGDNGSLSHNEVNPTRKYLLAAGIPDKDIYLDHAGFDTYSSMYRARDIFKAETIIITTQSFHIPRSVFIARHLGINAYGVSADRGHYRLNNYIREFFADVKAILDLAIKRTPKYLGEEIPITGDAQEKP
jgi:SanA protein